ncbi:MAG: type III pantothenate kinase [Oscillospiraceae bacterium]
MILGIDVGNTNIVIGCIDDKKIHFVGRISTDCNKTQTQYAIDFNNVLKLYEIDKNEITGSIISSVVPQLITILNQAIEAVTGKSPLVVGPGVKTGLNILIDNPAQLGSDLVVDAVAAISQYTPPLVIIDMGTATTISVIDKKCNYRGGVILPGVRISQDALSSRTSQLPYINLEAPKKVIGVNTIECMESGVIYGNSSMIDGIVDRIEEELNDKVTVIATGGLSTKIVPYCKNKIICDDNLLLKGLFIIYEKNKPKN